LTITLEKVKQRAESDAKTYGYYLNPDPEFLQDLLKGLKENEERYGYPSCPCRLASGIFEFDRDIICPCDYRDPDVAEYGACYCGLYVRKDVFEGKKPPMPIPERRPWEKQERAYRMSQSTQAYTDTLGVIAPMSSMVKKFWYCKQCGYVVFRDDPPFICPICKAKKEMFAEIAFKIDLQV